MNMNSNEAIELFTSLYERAKNGSFDVQNLRVHIQMIWQKWQTANQTTMTYNEGGLPFNFSMQHDLVYFAFFNEKINKLERHWYSAIDHRWFREHVILT